MTPDNCVLGRFLLRYQERKWFPFKVDGLSRSQQLFQKYGAWSLLMAWAPIGGDALTFVVGVMRVNFAMFLALTFAGKAGRYLAVVLAMKLAW